jgi:serine/threonine protein kinase
MPLAPGTRLGPYEILAPIGAGGMGEVYRARDTRLGREVAVKILSADFSKDPDRLRRFEQEAQAVSALNHPNILVIYDIGAADGSPYLVSELLEGTTLRERLHDGAVLSSNKALDYALQTAQGLTSAHEKGIVHRDLKPENLFLTADGRIKILDFGLAKLTESRNAAENETVTPTKTRHTLPNTLLGTVGYMSPEQASGRQIDFRSDQFSFGALVYEMVSGKRAFHRATSPETLTAVIREETEPLGSLSPQTPGPFRWLIERCLAKDANDRFASTRDLARELETIKAHLSELTSSKDAIVAPGRPKRRVFPVAVLATIALVSFAAAVAMWWGRTRTAETPELRFLTYSGHDSSPAASPDGKTIAFSSDRDGSRRIWLKDLASASELALSSGPNDNFPRFSPDGSMILFSRNDAGRTSLFRMATMGGEPRKLADNVVSEGDWSPDGRQIVFLRQRATDRAIILVGADGSGEREIARAPGLTYRPRWSPDSFTIAAPQGSGISGLPGKILLVGTDGKGSRTLPMPPGGFLSSSLAWSNDNEVLYSQGESVAGATPGAGNSRVIRQNVRSGVTTTLLRSPNNSLGLDIVGPGRIAFDVLSNRQNLREVSLREKSSQASSRWLTQGNSQDRQPVYSPDGEWILFTSNRSGNLDLWEISAKANALRRITENQADDWDPAFTPDGKNILWSSNRGGHLEIWMANDDGSSARQVTNDGADAENPTMTRDGNWIVYTSGNPTKQGIWKIHSDGSGATRLVSGPSFTPEVSPDGQYALYFPPGPQELMAMVRIADGVNVPVKIDRQFFLTSGIFGLRGRWMPNGKAIAFNGRDKKGVRAVFVQDFVPGQDTSKTVRPLADLDPALLPESFGMSPDGSRITISFAEQTSNLMLAERVPGISPPARHLR